MVEGYMGHMGLASACNRDLEKETKSKTWKSKLSPPVSLVPDTCSSWPLSWLPGQFGAGAMPAVS